jgi:RHS repeat-associated protein
VNCPLSPLYLGATEVHLDTSTSTTKYWAQRYYSTGSATIAVRSNKSGTSTLAYLAADQHGTSSLAVEATTQAITKRYTTPFGAARTGGTGTWPDDKTFLGKSADKNTGLTHIGAREYEPGSGRFLSVDPVLSVSDAQSLNGYTYANNTPATLSDPTGLCADIDCPTRPGPGYENTMPGHTPGKPKKSSNSIYAGTATTSSTGYTSTSTNGGGDDDGGGGFLHWLSGAVDTTINYGTAIVSPPDVWIGALETIGRRRPDQLWRRGVHRRCSHPAPPSQGASSEPP